MQAQHQQRKDRQANKYKIKQDKFERATMELKGFIFDIVNNKVKQVNDHNNAMDKTPTSWNQSKK